MKHVVCYNRFDPDEPVYEYDYDDTPETVTTDMIDRCFHDEDENLDAWLESLTF